MIQTDFGGAVERQSKTFLGAVSNLSDAGKNLLNDFGTPLLGMATKLVLGLTKGLEVVRVLPGPLKQIASEGAVVIGILTGMAAATGAVALGGLGAAAALTKLANAQAVTAVAGLSARMTGLANIFGWFGGKATAAFAGITPVVGAVGIAAVGLGLTLKAMADSEIRHQEELSEAINSQADALTDAANSARSYFRALKEAGADASKLFGNQSPAEFAANLEKVLKTADKLKLIAGLRSQGLDAAGLRKRGLELTEQAEPLQATLAALKKAGGAGGTLSLEGLTGGQQQAIRDFLEQQQIQGQDITKRVPTVGEGKGMHFEQVTTGIQVDPAALAQANKQLQYQADLLEKDRLLTQAATAEYEKFGIALEDVTKSGKQFETFMRLAFKNKDDAQSMNAALAATKARIEQIGTALKAAGVTDLSKAGLLKRLNDPSIRDSADLQAIFVEYAEAKDRENEILDAMAKRRQLAAKQTVEALSFAAQWEASLREGAIQKEEDELTQRGKLLEAQLAQVKGYGVRRIALEKELRKTLGQIEGYGAVGNPETRGPVLSRLQERADGIRAELGRIGEGANLELGLNKDKQQLDQDRLRLKTSQAKENIGITVRDVFSGAKDLQADENLSGAQNRLKEGLDLLNQMKARNTDLLKQSPELRSAFASAFGTLTEQLRGIEKAIPSERFRELQQDIRQALAETENGTEKLLTLEQARVLVNQQVQKGLVSQKAAAQELTTIAEQEGQIRRQMLKEQSKLEKDLLQQKVEGTEQVLNLLERLSGAEARRYGVLGQVEDREKKVRDLTREQLRAKIEARRQAAEEEVRQGGDPATVAKKFQADVNNILRDALVKVLDQRQTQQQDKQDAADAAARKGRKTVGGANSPLYVDEPEEDSDPGARSTPVRFTGVKTAPFGRGGPSAAQESVLAQNRPKSDLLTGKAPTMESIMASLGAGVKDMAEALKKVEFKGKLDVNVNLRGQDVSDFSAAGEGVGTITRTTVNGMFSNHDREGRGQSKTRGGKYGG